MASVIKAGNATNGIQITSDSTGILEIKTGTGSGTTAITVGTDQAVAIGGNNISAVNGLGFRNRIINGDCRIDQRNAGASVTPVSGQYTLDRWVSALSQTSKYSVQQNAGSVTPPAGFSNYLGVTSLSAYSVTASDFFMLTQFIEGFNVADLAWGTASAVPITLSFWVRSSLTGTFGGAIQNSAGNRSYPFSYTISSANTWEQKSLTISGDTSGTWLTNNGIGLALRFSLGMGSTYSGTAGSWAGSNLISATGATSVVGTNGATFYITGVQLEAGSVATPFERRDYGRELMMCQRYYYRVSASGTSYSLFGSAWNESTTRATAQIKFAVPMRIRPTALDQSGTAGNYVILHGATATALSSVPAFETYTTTDIGVIAANVSSGLTAGQASAIASAAANSTAYLAWSAEL